LRKLFYNSRFTISTSSFYFRRRPPSTPPPHRPTAQTFLSQKIACISWTLLGCFSCSDWRALLFKKGGTLWPRENSTSLS